MLCFCNTSNIFKLIETISEERVVNFQTSSPGSGQPPPTAPASSPRQGLIKFHSRPSDREVPEILEGFAHLVGGRSRADRLTEFRIVFVFCIRSFVFAFCSLAEKRSKMQDCGVTTISHSLQKLEVSGVLHGGGTRLYRRLIEREKEHFSFLIETDAII